MYSGLKDVMMDLQVTERYEYSFDVVDLTDPSKLPTVVESGIANITEAIRRLERLIRFDTTKHEFYRIQLNYKLKTETVDYGANND